MRKHPIEWLTGQWQAGVNLCEKGWKLRLLDEAAAWEIRAAKWAQELKDGIAFRSPRDIGRVETLDCFVVEDLPLDHPWHDSSILPWPHMTATGEGRPSNNPYSRHSALVAEVEIILSEWRVAWPTQPGPTQKPGRPPKDKPLSERANEWAAEMRYRPNREKAKEIAAREGVEFKTVEREVRGVRAEKRGKAGGPSIFPRR